MNDTRELDVELARWGNSSTGANNADFVNQPGSGSGNKLLWRLPAGSTRTRYQIAWAAGSVVWSAVDVGSGRVVAQQATTTAVPPAEGMLVHINLWMFRGRATAAADAVEVVLSGFQFTPLSAPAAAPAALSGGLLYLDFGPGEELDLMQLDLGANATDRLVGLGQGGSFFDMASTTSPDGSMYYATVQYKEHGPSIGPDPLFYGQTVAVELHAAAGPTITHRLNTSTCWHISAGAAPGQLLCLAEGPCRNTSTHACQPDTGTTTLRKIDLAAGTDVAVGRFPEGAVCYNEAAAHDPVRGLYYAYLDPGGVAAMDTRTGQVLWQKPFAKQAEMLLVHDFVIDASGNGYAAVSNLVSTTPVVKWGGYVATVDFLTMELAQVGGQDDVFGYVVSGKCSQPGTSPGAAKGCYGQLNDGFAADGVYWITAFHAGPPEVVLGVELSTGHVVFEQPPNNGGGNLVDMAYIPQPAARGQRGRGATATAT